ncbi:MAG: class I SAM-dependent methyltransferase [Thermodesulfobacteriota bacterium]
MKQDRIRWNRKYESDKGLGRPSPLVEEFHSLAPGKLVLDLAAGTGRNAVFLARLGYLVAAVDLADESMRSLRELNHPGILPVQADLDRFPLPSQAFDLVICCYFLDRRLFPYIRESLGPSGVLLFESTRESDQPSISQPRNRDYLLRSNELLRAFLGLRILYYEESLEEDPSAPGRTRSLARLAAVRDWTGDASLARKLESRGKDLESGS